MTIDDKKLLKKAKKLLEANDENFTGKLRNILGLSKTKKEIFKKYPKLEELLKTIGNTPKSEPSLDVKVEELGKVYFSDLYLEKIAEEKGFDFTEIEFEERKEFALIVATKVISYAEGDSLKYIPIFENIDFKEITKKSAKFSREAKRMDGKVTVLKKEEDELLQKMIDSYDADIDDVDEFEIERIKLQNEYRSKSVDIEKEYTNVMSDLIYEVLKVEKESFSEWEQTLLRLNCMAMLKFNTYTPFTKEEL